MPLSPNWCHLSGIMSSQAVLSAAGGQGQRLDTETGADQPRGTQVTWTGPPRGMEEPLTAPTADAAGSLGHKGCGDPAT